MVKPVPFRRHLGSPDAVVTGQVTARRVIQTQDAARSALSTYNQIIFQTEVIIPLFGLFQMRLIGVFIVKKHRHVFRHIDAKILFCPMASVFFTRQKGRLIHVRAPL